MPFEFTVDCETRVINILGRGTADLREVVDAIHSVASLARDHQQFALLSDTRELDYEPSVPDLLEIARVMFARREITSRRLAIVVQPGVHEQIGRMLASMSSYVSMRVDVFTDVDNALFWLRSGRSAQ